MVWMTLLIVLAVNGLAAWLARKIDTRWIGPLDRDHTDW